MININKVKRYSVKKRFSKVKKADFADSPVRGRSFSAFYNSLPNILKVKELRATAESIIAARRKKKAVIFMAGAHVIKCGLNPVIIELIRKKIITCICLNGAGIIHDFEVAFQGRTSEDVGKNLASGRFGMGKETADFLNNAVKEGVCSGLGLGEAVAEKITGSRLRYKNLSLLASAFKFKIPVCVFAAIGTDIIHQHPSFDAALTGEGSLRDFHLLVENVCRLDKGGVVLNFGSAVILPEVFLKALNLARNLGNRVKDFTAANFDMIYHYRPAQNLVSRPVAGAGNGYYIVGHHEVMLPLLAQAIIEKI
ncbi:MAG: deoxyhypusine synthase family protein [Candidatus Omnitrophica bacterium]|nr:deoxyhypusine synthase family protein [Candidatus Omnitrophota bacterium]MBL7151182.1 deoxyhypusine synthase family protein [Candidatus Omnitrophota bacterium]